MSRVHYPVFSSITTSHSCILFFLFFCKSGPYKNQPTAADLVKLGTAIFLWRFKVRQDSAVGPPAASRSTASSTIHSINPPESSQSINPSATSQAKRKRDEPESQAELSQRLTQRGWCRLDGPPMWAPVAFCEAMYARWGARIVALLEAERPRWFDNCGEAEAEAGCDDGGCDGGGDGGGDDGGGGGGGDGGVEERPGAAAARVASAALAAEGAGIAVSAAHPCKSRWEPWEVTGPRFYASIIEAALRPVPTGLATGVLARTDGATPSVAHSGGGSGSIAEGGALPPPPPQLRALLWPESEADAAAPRLTELGWTAVPPHSDPQALHAGI